MTLEIQGRETEFRDAYERAFSAVSELQNAFGQRAVMILCLDVSTDQTAGGSMEIAEAACRKAGDLDRLEDLKEVKKVVWGSGTPR